jgi:aminoglycoside/choline kinase family phosphotransferase
MDGHLPDQRRRTYERLAAVFPDLLRRQRQAPVTLIHGDAHWRNFLYPNDRAADRTRIFDWQSCTAGSAAHDLAYMLPRHWHPEPRRDLMDHLLARYHHTLLRCGVTDYAWDELWANFRLAAARHMVAPATNWYRWGLSDARPMPPAERAQRLERFLVPFDALRCQELLASL